MIERPEPVDPVRLARSLTEPQEPESAEGMRLTTLPATAKDGTIQRLESELAAYKKAKRLADLELVELEARYRDAEQLRQSPYYRLGWALIRGFSSLGGLGRLVPDLYRLIRDEVAAYRHQRQRLPRREATKRAADQAYEIDRVRERITALGPEGAAVWVRERALPPRLTARLLIEIGREVRRRDPSLAAKLGGEALRLDHSEHRVKWLALVLAEAGSITASSDLLREIIATGTRLNGTEQRVADEILSVERYLKDPLVVPPRTKRVAAQVRARRILLLAQQSLAYDWSSTSLRLHAMAAAVRVTGREIVVATLPGYPWTEDGAAVSTSSREIGEIVYHRLPAIGVGITVPDQYVRKAADVIESFAASQDIDAIQADLGIAGVLALHAGRALGIPVLLDHAGDEAFPAPIDLRVDESERLVLSRARQASLAREADILIQRRSLYGRRTDFLAPRVVSLNECFINGDQRACARLHDLSALHGRHVLGFLGEEMRDHDFGLLADLPAELATRHPDLAAPGILVAGLGKTLERMRLRASEAGFDSRLAVVLRPSVAAIPGLLGAMDLFVVPLRDQANPFLRPPFEILQALAFGIPVVVPCTPWAQTLRAEGLPLEMAAGKDAASLADCVASLLGDPALRGKAVERSREWQAQNANPVALAAGLSSVYGEVHHVSAHAPAV
jgi:glycosyltransferase involved in cell wall biosynthesis